MDTAAEMFPESDVHYGDFAKGAQLIEQSSVTLLQVATSKRLHFRISHEKRHDPTNRQVVPL
jgi:hypothetical protein